MIFLSEENELAFSQGIVSLYFYASWVPFHKRMMTLIGKIEEKHPEVKFYAIDVDHFKGLCKRFDVTSVPQIVTFVDNTETKRIEGLVLTSALKSAYADICNVAQGDKNGKED
jgi:thiol-disulfide isomerase/thioredoxin